MNYITEFVYRHEDGTEEVRYRMPTLSDDCEDMIKEVMLLEGRLGDDCPYFFRHVEVIK